MQRNIPAKRVIRNFIEYNRRPFNARDIVRDTGIKHKTVRNILPQLVQEGHIKVILREKRGNIYIKPPPDEEAPTVKQHDWKPKIEKLRLIYDLIQDYPCSDEIQAQSGFSRETIYRYLRILVADDCIGSQGCCYKQISFQPKLKPYSHYTGYSLKRKYDKKKWLLREIADFSRKLNQTPPTISSFMSERELRHVLDKITASYLEIIFA
ncbi:MAG: hypothetical protein K8R90_02070 [Candidatus Cloacimonetes bacterium]|nr:hypothetical protein [Candidatus Cloacimonadota bacterium]